MADQQSLHIRVTFAWWLKPYLFGVILVANLMQLEPDWQKVERMVCRAIKLRVV